MHLERGFLSPPSLKYMTKTEHMGRALRPFYAAFSPNEEATEKVKQEIKVG